MGGIAIERDSGRGAELEETHRALRRAFPPGLVLVVIVGVALRNSVPANRLVPWTALAAVSTVANLVLADAAVRRRDARQRTVATRATVVSLVAWATIWGALPFVVVPSGSSGSLLVFCAVLLLTLATLNIVAVASSRRHLVAVEVPILGGLMIGLIRTGDPLLQVLGLASPLYLVAVLGLHVELRAIVTRGARMASRNNELLSELQREHSLAEAANARLAETNELLTRLVQIDGLTQVANRRSFMERLHAGYDSARRHQRRLGVVYLDLDDFKAINDTFGYQVGDDVLVQTAMRVAAVVRSDELLARIGGDEFVILLSEPGAVEELDGLTERLLAAFRTPFDALGRTVIVGASLGVAVCRPFDLDAEQTVEQLLAQADSALYRAKELGRNRAVVANEIHEHDRARVAAEARGERRERRSVRVESEADIEADIEADAELMRVASDHSSSLFGIVNADATVRAASRSVERLLGHRLEVVRGAPFWEVIVPHDRQRLIGILQRLGENETVTLDTWVLHCDGNEVPFDFTVRNLTADPSVRGYLVSGQIARSLQMAREHAQFLATHDPATALFTRSAAHAQMLSMIAGAPAGSCVAVVQIDLDHLGHVNEVLGDHVGDEVVVLAARRIIDTVSSDDVVARWDGDEFLVASIGLESALQSLRDRVAVALEPLYVVDGSEVAVEAKVAMVIGALDRPIDDLLARVAAQLADIRLHRIDRSALPPPAVAERRLVIDQLQRAVEQGELVSWYQPFVDEGGRIVGFEALLRWHHPTRGFTAPDTFMPLLSLAGLDGRVDDIVLLQAVDFAGDLEAGGHSDIQVHINVRPRQLSSPGFAQRLIDRCAAAGVAPARLGVEVTESDLLHVGPVALDNLGALRRAGLHVAIDDFGTGFSSLSHLLELPVDSLKIDRRFISRLETDPTSAGLTAAVIGLADNLGLQCVAEGVETRAQRDLLVGMGGTLIQGHFYSPAIPADAALELAAAAPWDQTRNQPSGRMASPVGTTGDPTSR